MLSLCVPDCATGVEEQTVFRSHVPLGTLKNEHTAARTSADPLISSGSLEPLQPPSATIADLHLESWGWEEEGRKGAERLVVKLSGGTCTRRRDTFFIQDCQAEEECQSRRTGSTSGHHLQVGTLFPSCRPLCHPYYRVSQAKMPMISTNVYKHPCKNVIAEIIYCIGPLPCW